MNLNTPADPLETVCVRCGTPMISGGVCPFCVFGGLLSPPPAEESPVSAPPQRVGDYELIEELARGGMGVVWKARQRRLQREVALKFVLEGVLPGETVARRFRQEAEVAAQLSHPHIIAVHEVGEADGRYYISMELAAGGTLAQRLQKEPFPQRTAAELAGKLAYAMQHAHDHGVLHRDLKPGNVLFDAAGEPRISDFGLARLTTDRSDLTVSGSVMGTPSYMAPEQARGESGNLTTAADVYGLGAILYEMLAGRPVFDGEVPVEVLRRVIDEEPPKLQGINRDLETICQKCLCKKPEDRYRSARAMGEDLDRWLRGMPIRARRFSPPERLVKWIRRRPLLAGLWFSLMTAAVVIGSLVVTSKVQLAKARGVAEASALESEHRRADQHTTAAVLAIDRGDSLRALPSLAAAIRVGTGDEQRDRVNRIRFATIMRLAPILEQVWYPEWVQDVHILTEQELVVTCEGGKVRLLRMDDGTDAVAPMEPGPRLSHAALHPALKRLLAESQTGEVSVWDTTTSTCLSRLPGKFLDATWLFRDRGTKLALWEGKVARRFSLEKQGYDTPPMLHPANVEWAYLCEGGRRVVTCAGDRMLRVWNADTGALIGKPVSCPPDTQFLAEERDNHLVQVKQREGPSIVIDTERGGSVPANPATGDIRAARCDGSRKIFARSTREGFVVTDANEGDVLVTSTHGSRGNDARFSGDGARIFTRSIDSGGRLWSVGGGRALTPFLWQGTDPLSLALDTQGERIVVTSRHPEIRLWRVRPMSGATAETTLSTADMMSEWLQEQAVTRSRGMGAPFQRKSVDGHPALLCLPENTSLLHVRETADGPDLIPPLPHHSRVINAVFSPDGKKIASFTSSQCAYLWEAATGGQIGPLLRHDREIEDLVFSPDSTILVSYGAHTLRAWEASTGSAAAPPMLHRDPLYRAWWSDDGATVFAVDSKGRRREWNLSPDNRSFDELDTLARLYSAHRVTTAGALAPLTKEESREAWEAEKDDHHPQ